MASNNTTATPEPTAPAPAAERTPGTDGILPPGTKRVVVPAPVGGQPPEARAVRVEEKDLPRWTRKLLAKIEQQANMEATDAVSDAAEALGITIGNAEGQWQFDQKAGKFRRTVGVQSAAPAPEPQG